MVATRGDSFFLAGKGSHVICSHIVSSHVVDRHVLAGTSCVGILLLLKLLYKYGWLIIL